MRQEIYRNKNFDAYKKLIGEKYSPFKFNGPPGLTKDSPQIVTLRLAIIWKAMLQGKEVTQIFFTPLDKINENTQRYQLEWGVVKTR